MKKIFIAMINFNPIGLKDKLLFDNYFSKYPPNISEFTFTNLFCWRFSKKHEFAEFRDHLIIKSEKHLYQPVGKNPAEIIKELKGYKFERVEKAIAQNFNAAHQRDMDDYIYLLSELKELKGTKYQEKRNFIKRFQKYDPKICTINKNEIDDALHLAKRWCDVRNCQASPSMRDDDIALKEALVNFEALGLFGICIRINNKIEAIIIGEPLNNDTYVDHFERANTQFTGIYQFLLHEFVKRIAEKFKFLNREQDLGIEGLRKAKMSYHPAKFIEKYKIK